MCVALLMTANFSDNTAKTLEVKAGNQTFDKLVMIMLGGAVPSAVRNACSTHLSASSPNDGTGTDQGVSSICSWSFLTNMS